MQRRANFIREELTMTDTNPPTCREALQQIVTIINRDGYVGGPVDIPPVEAARAALAAPDRVAALPADVREALQAGSDWGPMTIEEWRNKWCRDTAVAIHTRIGSACSAVLAKYPETAPVPAEQVEAQDGLFEKVQDERDDLLAEKASWIRERDELIAERDRFEAEAERHSKQRCLAQDEVARLTTDAARLASDNGNLRFLAEWLLSQMRKEES